MRGLISSYCYQVSHYIFVNVLNSNDVSLLLYFDLYICRDTHIITLLFSFLYKWYCSFAHLAITNFLKMDFIRALFIKGINPFIIFLQMYFLTIFKMCTVLLSFIK